MINGVLICFNIEFPKTLLKREIGTTDIFNNWYCNVNDWNKNKVLKFRFIEIILILRGWTLNQ